MPYILEGDRERLDDFPVETPVTVGELNYVITNVIQSYILENYTNLCYTAVNDVVGAMECAKLELYRRVAAPYEDNKALLNGDVYLDSLIGKE